MTSLLEKLRTRVSASRARVEDLRAQITALEKVLAEEEDQLSRWAVAEAAVAEVLAEDHDTEGGHVPPSAVDGQASIATAVVKRVVSVPVTRADGQVLSADLRG